MPSSRVRPPLRRTPGARTRPSNDAGFTVVEALVSLVLLAVMATASTTAVVAATKTSKSSTDRVDAADLAQQDLQAARALRWPTYPAAIAAHPVKVGNTTYTVSRSVGTACPAPPNYTTSPFMTVTTTVTWPPANTATRVVMATELAC